MSTDSVRYPDAATLIWIVEKDGRPFGRLEDACFADMFWLSYRVVEICEQPRDRDAIFAKAFWHDAPLPTFRHALTGRVCTTAFAGGQCPTRQTPTVVIRGLDRSAM